MYVKIKIRNGQTTKSILNPNYRCVSRIENVIKRVNSRDYSRERKFQISIKKIYFPIPRFIALETIKQTVRL